MATKKGGKKAGGKKGGTKKAAKKGGTKRLQQQPSTGEKKHLRPTGPCKRNDETFKRSSSFLFVVSRSSYDPSS
jgi:hypothetical protein